MTNVVNVRNLTGYTSLDFVDGTSIPANSEATIDLDYNSEASETTGDRAFSVIRRQLERYVRNGQASVVGPDS
jgi:hypothetical protein